MQNGGIEIYALLSVVCGNIQYLSIIGRLLRGLEVPALLVGSGRCGRVLQRLYRFFCRQNWVMHLLLFDALFNRLPSNNFGRFHS